MIKKIFFQILFFILLRSDVAAQAAFMASVDAKQVPIGEIFEIKFSLKNAQGKDFRPPNFGEFNVMSGPNRMNSMTMLNGNATSSETYSYVLQAKKEGTVTIGVATIMANGKSLRTDPLSISVTQGKKQTISENASSKDAIFIKAEVSTTTAYVGQQIILDYKLYTRANISGMSRISEPTYDGFYKLDVNDYSHADNRVMIGGKPYISRILQRFALFPQREGALTVEPFTMQVGIIKENNVKEDDDPFGRFFSTQQSEQKVISTNIININVKSLPSAPPLSFSGGIGDFHVNFTLSPTVATTDDVLSLRMTIVGNGDSKRWLPPKFTPIEDLEIYEPKILKEQNLEVQGEWQTTKEFEYLIIPKKIGDFDIKPAFSYVNVESGNFRTIDTVFKVHITQGSNKIATVLSDKMKDIAGIKMQTTFILNIYHFYNSMLFWAFFIVPFLLFAGLIAWKQWEIQQNKRDINVLKRENAPKIAEQRLTDAEAFLTNGNQKLFYEGVAKAMYHYVSDKFDIPLAEFSKSAVREKLNFMNINVLHIDNFVDVLNKCEIARFAGQNTEGSAKTVSETARQVITDIENTPH